MKQEQLINEQIYDLRKEHKAIYQAWNKNAISLQYVGEEITSRATVAVYDGLTIRYIGSGTTVTVAVAENTLTLNVDGTPTVYDLTAAAYDTIGELVAVIHALADWTCIKGADIATGVLSKHLAILTATECKSQDVTCLMDRALFVEAPNDTPDTNIGVDGKIFLRNTSYDTLAELVAFLDGLADYECSLKNQFDGSESSATLTEIVATDIKTASVVFLRDTNLQIKIAIPVTAPGKKITITKVLGSVTGTGASTFEFTKGSTLAWLESAGLTTAEKVSTLPSLDSDVGEQIILRLKMVTTLTAGYLTVAYDEKQADAVPLFI